MKNNKMYLTQAEADAKGLPSVQEQIARHNAALTVTVTRGTQSSVEVPKSIYDEAIELGKAYGECEVSCFEDRAAEGERWPEFTNGAYNGEIPLPAGFETITDENEDAYYAMKDAVEYVIDRTAKGIWEAAKGDN
jgi:hypothetical protein